MGAFFGIVLLWRWAWGGDSDSDIATGTWVGDLGSGSWAAAREFRAGYSEAGSAIGASSGIWSSVSWFRFVFDSLVLSHGDGVLNTDSGTDKEPLHRLHLQYSLSLSGECDWCVQSALGDHFSLEILTSILDIHKVTREQFPHFDSTIKTLYTPLRFKNLRKPLCGRVRQWLLDTSIAREWGGEVCDKKSEVLTVMK